MITQKQVGKTYAISDLPTGGVIGLANVSVDNARQINITQTTAGQSLTLPSPTESSVSFHTAVANTGTASFVILGLKVPVNSVAFIAWNSITSLWTTHDMIMGGATNSLAGNAGYVPAPLSAQQDFKLFGDAIWVADRLGSQIMLNLPTGGTLPTIVVDGFSLLNVQQSTAGQVITISPPTVITKSRSLYIASIGTSSFKIGNNNIAPGTVSHYVWIVGTGWELIGPPSLNSVSPVALPNFTANGTIGTAAATVDVSATFTVAQTTLGIAVTIPTPTTLTVGSAINILNIGTANISINGNPATPKSTIYFVWNGTDWVADAPSLQLSSPDNTKTITISNVAIGLNGPVNYGSANLGNLPTNGPLVTATSVDLASLLLVTQTSVGTLTTLPNPTVLTPGRTLAVANTAAATTSISVNGVAVFPGKQINFVWDGAAWASPPSTAATASAAVTILNKATNYILSPADISTGSVYLDQTTAGVVFSFPVGTAQNQLLLVLTSGAVATTVNGLPVSAAIAQSPTEWVWTGSLWTRRNVSTSMIEQINLSAHGFTMFTVLSHNGITWIKAKADSGATVAQAIVTRIVDANNFEVTTFGRVFFPAHGLVVGDTYWLSQTTAGVATVTQPSSGINQSVLNVRDANTVFVRINQAISI